MKKSSCCGGGMSPGSGLYPKLLYGRSPQVDISWKRNYDDNVVW